MRRRTILATAALLGSLLFYRYLYPLRHFLSSPREVMRTGGTPRNRSITFKKDRDSRVFLIEAGDNIKDTIGNALKATDWLKKLEIRGKEVLVKPNVNSDDPHPATTNPEVVRATVELLYEAGARKVVVGDMSGIYWLPTEKSMRRTGIASAAEDAGAELVFFEEEEWVKVELPGDTHLKNLSIPLRVYSAEVLVSLPVVKTHRYATYSMSLKNLVGTISGPDRRRLHTSPYMEEMIAEISLAVSPDIIIMDGTRSMVAGGPTRGSVRDTGVIILSRDPVATDVVGLSIVKSFGEWKPVLNRSVWHQRQVSRAIALHLGAEHADQLELLPIGESQKFLQLLEAVKKAIRE